MSQHLPPLPWSYTTNAPVDKHEGSGFVYLHDASGRKIGTVWGKPDEKLAIAALVLQASELWACEGCGSLKSIHQIKAEHPEAVSCCPERKLSPLSSGK